MGYFNNFQTKPESTNVLISTIFFDKKMAPSLHNLPGCYHERLSEEDYKSFRYDKIGSCSTLSRRRAVNKLIHNVCYVSVILSFILGVTTGVFIPLYYLNSSLLANNQSSLLNRNTTLDTRVLENNFSANKLIRSVFVNNSYSNINFSANFESQNSNDRTTPSTTEYQTVLFIEPSDNLDDVTSNELISDRDNQSNNDKLTKQNNYEPSKYDSGIIKNGIYWGALVERSLPSGYDDKSNSNWYRFLNKSIAVKLEAGCGRMQNRLVTFKDGSQACARYRQNTDQIQGELFSFYLAQILNLPNLAPSAISIVDLSDPNWKYLSNEIANAQWNANRAVVLTKYIPNLDSAFIPKYFKPTDRHLNKHDVRNLTGLSNNANIRIVENSNIFNELIELAQWSDLIIFDYLTANLDRIVNNLYNYQWNVNIMDAPAHNLARKLDSNLLLFLDNESGLLHGYRLLDKYETYHRLLLDNLCLFRKSTVDVIKSLKQDGNVGSLLKEMFNDLNSDKVKDILPVLPDKSIKILNSRIDRVYKQIARCESMYYETQF